MASNTSNKTTNGKKKIERTTKSQTRSNNSSNTDSSALLKHILHNDLRVNNRKQPTNIQCDHLEAMNKESQKGEGQPFNKCSLEAWYEKVKPCELDLFFHLEAGWKQCQENMIERAQAVVKAVKADKAIDTIVFMDGHGRFFYTLLSELRHDNEMHERLKNMRFVIVDIDGDVHRWHELFFPKNVTSIHGNIYELDSKYYAKNCFLYFNFCGIGGSKGQQRFRSFITSDTFQHQTKFMVSFSTRGYKSCNRDWFPSSDIACKQFEVTDVTPNKLKFVTFELTRKIDARLRDIERVKRMTTKELRAFVASRGLKGINTNTGGHYGRTREEFRNDVIAALKQE